MLPNEENVQVRSSKIHLVTNSNFHISHKTPSLPPKIGIVFISLGTTVMPRRNNKNKCYAKVWEVNKLYDNGRCANGECITTVVKRSVLFSAGRLLDWTGKLAGNLLSESQQIEFYIFKMAMILVVNKCKPRLKRFTCVESIVFAHLHLNRSKFGTYEFRRF